MTDEAIAEEVRAARNRVKAMDPGAYSGFCTDTAIRAVAKRMGLDWRVVLRAYRTKYPRPTQVHPWARPFPNGARPPSPEARAAA